MGDICITASFYVTHCHVVMRSCCHMSPGSVTYDHAITSFLTALPVTSDQSYHLPLGEWIDHVIASFLTDRPEIFEQLLQPTWSFILLTFVMCLLKQYIQCLYVWSRPWALCHMIICEQALRPLIMGHKTHVYQSSSVQRSTGCAASDHLSNTWYFTE